MPRLLVIDDEKYIRYSISEVFVGTEVAVRTVESGDAGVEQVAAWNPDVVFLDLRLGRESGLDVFRRIREVDPKAVVVLMTGFGTSDVAIEAMKQGAFDYIVKPLDAVQLKRLVEEGCRARRLVHVPAFVGQVDRSEAAPQAIVGSGDLMRAVCKQIGRVAGLEVNVLIGGEAGTEKELVARAIYHHSPRNTGPFLAVRCDLLSAARLERELFGCAPGVDNADPQRRIGKLEQCREGTLLLEEVSEMPAATQLLLQRCLEAGQFERPGAGEVVETRPRILSTTSRDLDQCSRQGTFHRDLLYRLREASLVLPPLRDRKGDLPELAHHYLFRCAAESGGSLCTIAAEAMEILTQYNWPGNVRELQNVIQGALIASTGTVLTPSFLPPALLQDDTHEDESIIPVVDDVASWQAIPPMLDRRLTDNERDLYRRLLEDVDRFVVARVMRHTGNNQARAAELLGLSRLTLRNKLRVAGIIRTSSNTTTD